MITIMLDIIQNIFFSYSIFCKYINFQTIPTEALTATLISLYQVTRLHYSFNNELNHLNWRSIHRILYIIPILWFIYMIAVDPMRFTIQLTENATCILVATITSPAVFETDNQKSKNAFINSLFSPNYDDKINCGGLLQLKHACSISINEIFHINWYRKSLPKFKLEPQPIIENESENDLSQNDQQMIDLYFEHFKELNWDIWKWYRTHIPDEKQMNKIYNFLNNYLLNILHKTLNLPNIKICSLNNMINIFGSMSYGLYIHPIQNCYGTINIIDKLSDSISF